MADDRNAASAAGAAINEFLRGAVAASGRQIAQAAPILAPLLSPGGRAAARDFSQGLVTGGAARAPAAPAKAAPAKPKPTPQQAVTQALEKGSKAAPNKITPQGRAMAAISTILSQPFTIDEFNAATGALPQVAASTAKVSNKDQLYGQYGAITDAIFQAQLAQAGQLAGAERDKATLDAFEARRKSLIEGLGVDPSKAALAQLYAQQEE